MNRPDHDEDLRTWLREAHAGEKPAAFRRPVRRGLSPWTLVPVWSVGAVALSLAVVLGVCQAPRPTREPQLRVVRVPVSVSPDAPLDFLLEDEREPSSSQGLPSFGGPGLPSDAILVSY